MKIGKYNFDTKNKTYVMGILNVTPDSFSDGGQWNNMDKALFHTEQMINEGASIIDIGGESTRPGYTQISVEEELERVIPVISAVRQRFDIPVSVDTYKSVIAQYALDNGADMVNDIWGFKLDPNMAKVAAERNAVCCLMHNKKNAEYNDFIADLTREILACTEIALNNGVKRENIIIDPGIGFGKTHDMNLSAIKNLDKLRQTDYPVLLGCSRKSVIGNVLDLPAEQRLEGTLATTVMAVLSGCAFVRVHDIKENVRAIKMAEAIKYAK